MTDFTGKLIANTYKDILTIAASVENSGIDSTLRRVQDGGGNNSPLKLSESAAAFTGNVSVNGSLTINGAFQPQNIQTSAVRATTVSATNITTDVLTAGTLTFQDVSVSTLRAGTVSATTINAGSTLTVDGDSVITSAVAVSTAAILRAQIATTIANTSAALQANIDVVSVGLSATNTQTQLNATQINTLSTSITANASAITVNSDAITSINNILGDGSTYASAGTSATLETRIAGVSATMATSIANVSSTLEARIAGVSTALASTSAALTSNINTVSATLSIANVSIAANSSQIAAVSVLTKTNKDAITSINSILTSAYASSGTSATLETRINSVSVLAETKASAATSATLETRIAAVSATMATSIGNSNSAITALSATMATSIGNSNSVITALSATMATSIANHLPLAGGTLTGTLTLNADPTSDLNAATKQYVDNLTASGIHFHESVRVENPGALTVTYNNGTAGVGATLTNAGTQAVLVLDGITMVVDDRVLIYEQADATQNGVYVVTSIGSGSTNWVLTRSSDTDTAGEADANSLDEGSYFFVEEGNTGAGESYICNTSGTITFGTTEITFVQFSSSLQYTAGTGININASRVISTSGVATTGQLTALSATMATSIGNSNTNITTNANAITSINGVIAGGAFASAGTSATLETRIAGVSATMATSISNYLPLAGGTMTGNLSFGDNNKAIFGAGTDLQIYHDGSNTGIQNSTGELFIYGGSDQIRIRAENGEESIVANPNGSVDVYHNGSRKLATTSTGIDVTGTVTADGLTVANTGLPTITIQDQDGTNQRSFFRQSAATAIITSQNGTSYGEFLLSAYNGTNTINRFKVFSGGDISFYEDTGIDVKLTWDASAESLKFADNSKAIFGAGSDLQIYHDGSNSYVKDAGTGDLYIQGTQLRLQSATGESFFVGVADGGAYVYHNGSAKLNTTSTGIDVTGNVKLDADNAGIQLKSGGVGTEGLIKWTFNTDNTVYATAGIAYDTRATDGFLLDVGYPITLDATTNIKFKISGSEEMRLEADGDLHVDGNVIAYSTTISDKRLKKDIAPIDNALWKVSQLNGCTFTYLKDDRKSAGLIAQDLEKVLPSAVIEDEAVFHGEEGETYKTVQYDQVIGLLVEAVKELTAKVEELENASTK